MASSALLRRLAWSPRQVLRHKAVSTHRWSLGNGHVRAMQHGAAMREEPVPPFSLASHLGLEKYGIPANAKVYRNLSYEDIALHEDANNEGEWTANGTFAIDTGKFTGRSPKDKYFVAQSPSQNHLWWGPVNQPMQIQVFDQLMHQVRQHFAQQPATPIEPAPCKVYVFDGFCGADLSTRKKVRFITELAWQHHFVTNMFIPQHQHLQQVGSRSAKGQQSQEQQQQQQIQDQDQLQLHEIEDFGEPDFTIVNACRVINDNFEQQKLHSEVFVAFNLEAKVALIGGTWYGGEMKKGIFSLMNYWLPFEGIMPMHCAANKSKSGDSTALFFGLSGTGKTTLSADPQRVLIGDDEHGWNHHGIFNFEGGCYAKTINLQEANEPEIYRAIRTNALLENVFLQADKNNEPDYFNVSKTQNGRVSYPLDHIPNADPSGCGGHPNQIVFLTCDAYGVLPPVAKLTEEQAMYHFLSGYTAKVAGTERGIVEPEATFSACFGAAFMTLHPTKYADLLQQKIRKHNTRVYLVNTGWTGGPYGVGKRMSIKDTRQCIDCILDGSIEQAQFQNDPLFGFAIPKQLGSIDQKVLNPRESWQDKHAYDQTAHKLAQMFKHNYEQYIAPGFTDYSAFGPQV